ncbi:AraC family transcriptional regulator [Betaproteobacteria bacterium]|nr:AraC family transcriptional regulator [Betaproteobacteria bacterium]
MKVTKIQDADMDRAILDSLTVHTELEEKQLGEKRRIQDWPEDALDGTVYKEKYFLNDSNVFISKHPRFAPYPAHRHGFLEMNFMLSGISVQTVNGYRETLGEGDILFLGRDSEHSLDTLGENDILINVIFTNKHIDLEWLSAIHRENSIVFDFLAQTLSRNPKKQYLIFRSGANGHIRQILERMIEKYYSETVFAREIVFLYVPILITELIGNCALEFHSEGGGVSEGWPIMDILQYIEANYATVTLNALSRKFGYNKNYLCNLIREKTSRTFTDLVTAQRMRQARFLLENTDIPLYRIIETIGLENKSHFYRQFLKHIGKQPGSFRARQRK